MALYYNRDWCGMYVVATLGKQLSVPVQYIPVFSAPFVGILLDIEAAMFKPVTLVHAKQTICQRLPWAWKQSIVGQWQQFLSDDNVSNPTYQWYWFLYIQDPTWRTWACTPSSPARYARKKHVQCTMHVCVWYNKYCVYKCSSKLFYWKKVFLHYLLSAVVQVAHTSL